jgi:hypothetical protein
MTCRQYIDFLVENRILLLEFSSVYIDLYEKYRFGSENLSEFEFKDFIKVYTALVKSIIL